VLGAGDAFSAGFLSGWLRGEDYDACCRYANACGALVVSRHGCAPAMPTKVELDHYLAHVDAIPRPDRDETLTRLHAGVRRARRDRALHLRVRPSQPALRSRALGRTDESRLPALKRLFVRAVEETEAARNLHGRVGLLCDDRYGRTR